MFPYPPIPERVQDEGLLQRMAQARDDDLIFGGSIDTSSPERLLHASSEAANQYYQAFSSYISSLPARAAEAPAKEEETGSVDVNEVLYGLMSERDRLAELAKLSGQLRYAIGGRDTGLVNDTIAEINQLAKYLPEKFKVNEVLKAAQRPGPEGDRLTKLYLDRAYRLADEDYEGVKRIEEEIGGIA